MTKFPTSRLNDVTNKQTYRQTCIQLNIVAVNFYFFTPTALVKTNCPLVQLIISYTKRYSIYIATIPSMFYRFLSKTPHKM